MKRKCLLAVFLVSAVSCSKAIASDLEALGDSELARFVGTLEHLATSANLPFLVRVFRSYDLGECGANASSCPQDRVYLSVSTFDEAPEIQVYRSPEGYGWKFVRWGPAPTGDSPKDFVSIVLRRRLLSPDPSKTWFAEDLVRMEVNPWSGRIIQLDGIDE